MTNEQKIGAIHELTIGLTADQLRDIVDDLSDIADEVAKTECIFNGHKFDNDVCGKPEHRFCYHCFQRESEVNPELRDKLKETKQQAANLSLPSESLGLRSRFTRWLFS